MVNRLLDASIQELGVIAALLDSSCPAGAQLGSLSLLRLLPLMDDLARANPD
jgi:hypothetical protein